MLLGHIVSWPEPASLRNILLAGEAVFLGNILSNSLEACEAVLLSSSLSNILSTILGCGLGHAKSSISLKPSSPL